MKNTEIREMNRFRDRKRVVIGITFTSGACFLYLCFNDAIAEKLREKLEARTISTEYCVKFSEYPGTIYLGKDTVLGL